jgi:hypothetical protein
MFRVVFVMIICVIVEDTGVHDCVTLDRACQWLSGVACSDLGDFGRAT